MKSSLRKMEWAYHVTLREFLPSIAKKGLQPDSHESANGEEVIFVERSQEEAEVYAAPDTVTLRFLVDGFGCTEDGEDVLYDVTIPAVEIEVYDKKARSWRPLKERR